MGKMITCLACKYSIVCSTEEKAIAKQWNDWDFDCPQGEVYERIIVSEASE